MGRSVSVRRKEHQRHLRLGNRNQLWHPMDGTQNIVCFVDTEICKSPAWSERVIRKYLEIQLTQGVINKDKGAEN